MGEREDTPTVADRPGGNAPARASSASVTTPSAFDPPPDRFEARAELGRGGMGRVEEAFDRALGRPVAIKHMLAPSSTDLARFEREARITARLEHPGIVPIHDAGRTPEGTPYYVMRRVDGQPLSEVAAGKTLDERLALVPNILAVCDAVAFAHARSIVHRDIKPTNILIGPFGETLLIDWGLAREIGSSGENEATILPSEPDLTRAGTVAGTPGFMAPEQARGESVDARADVFALGSTLFYVLAGQLPWHASGGTEMIAHVGANRPADWRLLPAEVPVDLRAVLEKAMAPDPAKRYADAGALAADLRRFITGNLVGAHTYGRMARLVRFIKRHRAVVAVTTASLVVVAVIATLSVRRVVAERDGANMARALAEQRQREATALADGLLVDNARQLADTDPVAAIAKLRSLPPTSTKWPEAWAAASAAYFHGVPFGFVSPYPGPSLIRMSADNRYLLAVTSDAGRLTLVDLQTRSSRILAELGRINTAEWFGSWIVANAIHSVIAIDVSTGKTLRLALPVVSIRTNRKDRMLLLTDDHRLFEMTPDSIDAPREIDHGIEDIAASWDLSTIAVKRGEMVEMWTDKGHWPLSRQQHQPIMYVVPNMIVLLARTDIEQWVVGATGPELRQTWPRESTVLACAIAKKVVYQVDTNGLALVNPEGFRTTILRGTFQTVFQTPRGFVASDQDGRIAVIDDSGFFTIGPRPQTYRALDQTPDGRFVTAITRSGEILVWDLQYIRGHRLDVDGSLTPIALGAHSLYVMDFAFGLGRVDLETGTFTQLSSQAEPAIGQYTVERQERMVGLFTTTGRITVYDIVHRRTVTLADGDGTSYTFNEDGIWFGTQDGTIRHWTLGDEAAGPPRVKLDGEITTLATRPGRWLATVGPRRVIRLADTGAHEETSVPDDVIATVLQPDGRAWLLTSNGSIQRWDVGAPSPTLFPTPEPIDLLVPTLDGVQFHSSKSLLTVDWDGHQRVTSVVSTAYRDMSPTLAATATSTGEVHIIDIVTGQHFQLPQRVLNQMMIVGAKRVAIQTDAGPGVRRLVYWDLDIPREPDRLQRWLSNVTNARPVPGSDAVAWPEH